MSKTFHPYKSPFKYNDQIASIFDSNNQRVLDIRGWGYLTGKGVAALGLDEEEAIKILHSIGEKIVELMNKEND